MPKTIHTPRDELVCGKLDRMADEVRHLGSFKSSVDMACRMMELLGEIQSDVDRMEAKLIARKDEAASIPKIKADAIREAAKVALDDANKHGETFDCGTLLDYADKIERGES